MSNFQNPKKVLEKISKEIYKFSKQLKEINLFEKVEKTLKD